jgi:NDP-sugar pyrophosphorylase family protein
MSEKVSEKGTGSICQNGPEGAEHKLNLSPLAILAGGLATRLRPLTEKIPKALIDINGEPFIAHQLRLLAAGGIREVVLCTGYLGHMIEECVGDGAAFGLHVRYSPDGPKLLGTAGCLKQAAPLLGETFFVLYGDSYLPCDYRAVAETFERSGQQALMTVYRNEGLFDTSNIEYADGQIVRYDKKNRTPAMRHIDYGLGVLRREALDIVPAGEPFDLAALYQAVLARGGLAAFEVPERFYEIGSPAGIDDLRQYLNEARK